MKYQKIDFEFEYLFEFFGLTNPLIATVKAKNSKFHGYILLQINLNSNLESDIFLKFFSFSNEICEACIGFWAKLISELSWIDLPTVLDTSRVVK